MILNRGAAWLLFFQLSAFVAAVPSCWSPSGVNMTQYANFSPCNVGAEVSHCCEKTDICLSNGYCFLQRDYYYSMRVYRGACTDSEWGTDCPQYCRDVEPNGLAMIPLVQNDQQGTFCCANGTNVSNGNDTCFPSEGSVTPFILPPGQAIFDRATGRTINDTENLTITNTTSAQNSSASSSASASPTASAASAQTSCPVSSAHNAHDNVAIGVGVGIPLGLISILMTFLFLRERVHRKAAENAARYGGPDANTLRYSSGPSEATVWEKQVAHQHQTPELPTISRPELPGNERMELDGHGAMKSGF